MKKISLSALLLTAGLWAASQSADFGIKGGVNISDISWEGQADLDNRIGFHVGLLAHIHLSPQWAVQPEIQYSTEGAKMATTAGEYTWKTDYVNIPVMLQYMFDNGFRLEAGPLLGLMVNSDDNDDVFKSVNVGLGFGLNYLTHSGVGIGGRYNLGLTRITEATTTEAKSRNFQISLFYMFNNSHKARSR